MGSTLSVNARPNSIPVFCESIHDYRGVQILNLKKNSKRARTARKEGAPILNRNRKRGRNVAEIYRQKFRCVHFEEVRNTTTNNGQKKNKKIMPVFLLVCFAFVLLLFPL
jgi:hypothetical protein